MDDIEKAIKAQQKLITNWEQRIQELEEVIKKYPWGRDGLEYDFGDWRETELKRRKEQIKIALIIISALEKQMPKKVECFNGLNETCCPECHFVFGYSMELGEYDGENYNYCVECGQKLDWEVENE